MGGRVGWAEAMEPEEVFFVTFILSFVSTIVLCGRGRGTYAKERGMRGRKWTYVAINGRMGGRA